jgi:shikimate kinase
MTSKSEPDEDGAPCGTVNRPPLRTVFLTGFMGSGKTTVGAALAILLGWRFEDLDVHIEAREHRTIAEIFRRDGEPKFREIERQVLSQTVAACVSTPAVVALGGGTFAQPANSEFFADAATVTVFLDAPVEELWARCQDQPNARPLRQNPEHFRNLYQDRREFYTRAGLHIQTSGKSVDAIAEEIARRLRCDYELKEKT